MPEPTPVTVEGVVETKPAEGSPPAVAKTVETSTKTVTAGTPAPPVSTYFDDTSRLIMTLAALLSFDAMIAALIWQHLLTTEMITLIIGLVGGWLGASWSYSFGSSSGSKNKDIIAQTKIP